MDNAAASSTELSFDDALALGIEMLKAGAFDDAARLYDALSGFAPDDPNVLHYSGVLAHHQGRSEQAIELIRRSLAVDAAQADCYSNLGIIYNATHQIDAAIGAYEKAIALDPQHANAYNNLGVLLRATGERTKAEAAFRKAIAINPQFIDAYHNLGVLLARIGRTEEAVICYCKVTTLSPRHPETRRMLGLAYCTLGQRDKAIELYEEWLSEEPGHPVVSLLLAGCTGRNVPARASDECMQVMFDGFAKTFESKLEHLRYCGPALVGMMLESSSRKANKDLDVLDAGCGTGWCGPVVAPFARRLTGVDLSAGMLEQAKQKQVYDDLVQGELTRFLMGRPASFDLIVSADTLIYFGDLTGVAVAARAALRRRGLFVFTVEELVSEDDGQDYSLEPQGRYTHAQRYVERVFADARFTCAIEHAELRMESGVPVRGLVVRASTIDGATHG